MPWPTSTKNEWQKRRNAERRARNQCIICGESPLHRGGRCAGCWRKKLDSDALRYRHAKRLRDIARAAAARKPSVWIVEDGRVRPA